MSTWQKTGCVLCAQNCGLEVLVENDRMVKVRPDKANPRSEGYACRKGLNVICHQYPKDRLKEPLRRVGNRFEAVSWEQAIDEIAGKMHDLATNHGARSLAYMGGGSQGVHIVGNACDRSQSVPGKGRRGRFRSWTRPGRSDLSGALGYTAGTMGRHGRYRKPHERDQDRVGEDRARSMTPATDAVALRLPEGFPLILNADGT